MEPFTKLTSRMIPVPIDNIDTDIIVPARFLKVTDKAGMDQYLFRDWRFDEDGNPKPDFILNQPSSQGAQILLAGKNFGSGSSREHAPWALLAFGFRAVISTSFADIFNGNSLKNGLLPLVVPPDVHAELFRLVEKDPGTTVTIDLASQCLLAGVDQLGYVQKQEAHIRAYEASHPAAVETTAKP